MASWQPPINGTNPNYIDTDLQVIYDAVGNLNSAFTSKLTWQYGQGNPNSTNVFGTYAYAYYDTGDHTVWYYDVINQPKTWVQYKTGGNINYKGEYDGSGGTYNTGPFTGTSKQGDFWVVTQPGFTYGGVGLTGTDSLNNPIGSPTATTFAPGDWIYYTGSNWQQIPNLGGGTQVKGGVTYKGTVGLTAGGFSGGIVPAPTGGNLGYQYIIGGLGTGGVTNTGSYWTTYGIATGTIFSNGQSIISYSVNATGTTGRYDIISNNLVASLITYYASTTADWNKYGTTPTNVGAAIDRLAGTPLIGTLMVNLTSSGGAGSYRPSLYPGSIPAFMATGPYVTYAPGTGLVAGGGNPPVFTIDTKLPVTSSGTALQYQGAINSVKLYWNTDEVLPNSVKFGTTGTGPYNITLAVSAYGITGTPGITGAGYLPPTDGDYCYAVITYNTAYLNIP
jgi:hypothetical protein